MVTPEKVTQKKLLDLLDLMKAGITSGDSLEGSLEYAAISPDEFNLVAAIRIGNLQGQGGTILIGESS